MSFQFQGRFYLARSSLSVDLAIDADQHGGIGLQVEGQRLEYAKGEYDIEPRLGSTPRVILFREGSRFETPHSPAFAAFERVGADRFWLRYVDWLERRWQTALSCVATVALLAFAFVYWGIPWLAGVVADSVSQELREKISRQSLDTMESLSQLTRSGLEEGELEASQRAFAKAMRIAGIEGSEYAYKLYNRSMGGIENAFALPSGTIVATDSFVRMCETEEQMVAVFLHEIAHVEEQHGIRSIVQQTGLLVLGSMVLGDVSAVANVAGALPVLLIESQYSQRFELESDTFAGELLESSGIGAEALVETLVLLHRESPEEPLTNLLSTHPSLRKRIENLRRIQGSE